MKSVKAGLSGIGAVGSGTFNVLKRNQEEITRRAGRSIQITMGPAWSISPVWRAPIRNTACRIWRSSRMR